MSEEEELLATMVSEIYEMHSQTKRKVAYDHWAGSLQMLCLEARRAEIESDIIALAPRLATTHLRHLFCVKKMVFSCIFLQK